MFLLCEIPEICKNDCLRTLNRHFQGAMKILIIVKSVQGKPYPTSLIDLVLQQDTIILLI